MNKSVFSEWNEVDIHIYELLQTRSFIFLHPKASLQFIFQSENPEAQEGNYKIRTKISCLHSCRKLELEHLPNLAYMLESAGTTLGKIYFWKRTAELVIFSIKSWRSDLLPKLKEAQC